jgi:Cdc6-like AAA superfamily ATPase
LFKEDVNDLKTWLRGKGFLSSKISFENYVKIASVFLKMYHIKGTTNEFKNGREFKKRAILDSYYNLKKIFLTKEQAGLVNVHLDHCNDLWVTGAAGTGKTLVLKHRARSLTELYSDSDENVILVITFNLPINKDIE